MIQKTYLDNTNIHILCNYKTKIFDWISSLRIFFLTKLKNLARLVSHISV